MLCYVKHVFVLSLQPWNFIIKSDVKNRGSDFSHQYNCPNSDLPENQDPLFQSLFVENQVQTLGQVILLFKRNFKKNPVTTKIIYPIYLIEKLDDNLHLNHEIFYLLENQNYQQNFPLRKSSLLFLSEILLIPKISVRGENLTQEFTQNLATITKLNQIFNRKIFYKSGSNFYADGFYFTFSDLLKIYSQSENLKCSKNFITSHQLQLKINGTDIESNFLAGSSSKFSTRQKCGTHQNSKFIAPSKKVLKNSDYVSDSDTNVEDFIVYDVTSLLTGTDIIESNQFPQKKTKPKKIENSWLNPEEISNLPLALLDSPKQQKLAFFEVDSKPNFSSNFSNAPENSSAKVTQSNIWMESRLQNLYNNKYLQTSEIFKLANVTLVVSMIVCVLSIALIYCFTQKNKLEYHSVSV